MNDYENQLTFIKLLVEIIEYNSSSRIKDMIYSINDTFIIYIEYNSIMDVISLGVTNIKENIDVYGMSIYRISENKNSLTVTVRNSNTTSLFKLDIEEIKELLETKDIVEHYLRYGRDKKILDNDILYNDNKKYYYTLIDYKHHIMEIKNEI